MALPNLPDYSDKDVRHDFFVARMRELPNKLTIARICAVPILLIAYPIDWPLINASCALLFGAAAITDFLDGYLARKYKSVTKLGILLDPVADKILTGAALILVAYAHATPIWVAGALLCREMAVNGLRLVAMEQNIQIKVSGLGKLKTIALDIALFCLLFRRDWFGVPFLHVGMISIYAALAISYFSAWQYCREFMDTRKDSL